MNLHEKARSGDLETRDPRTDEADTASPDAASPDAASPAIERWWAQAKRHRVVGTLVFIVSAYLVGGEILEKRSVYSDFFVGEPANSKGDANAFDSLAPVAQAPKRAFVAPEPVPAAPSTTQPVPSKTELATSAFVPEESPRRRGDAGSAAPQPSRQRARKPELNPTERDKAMATIPASEIRRVDSLLSDASDHWNTGRYARAELILASVEADIDDLSGRFGEDEELNGLRRRLGELRMWNRSACRQERAEFGHALNCP